jgi:hypothetical protein
MLLGILINLRGEDGLLGAKIKKSGGKKGYFATNTHKIISFG